MFLPCVDDWRQQQAVTIWIQDIFWHKTGKQMDLIFGLVIVSSFLEVFITLYSSKQQLQLMFWPLMVSCKQIPLGSGEVPSVRDCNKEMEETRESFQHVLLFVWAAWCWHMPLTVNGSLCWLWLQSSIIGNVQSAVDIQEIWIELLATPLCVCMHAA